MVMVASALKRRATTMVDDSARLITEILFISFVPAIGVLLIVSNDEGKELASQPQT